MPRIQDDNGGPFSRIEVDYLVKGESRITWTLRDDFVECDASQHTFQLQANPNWDEPNSWENVGLPVTNAFFAIDDTQRQFGRVLRVAYRVVMTTPCDTYTSQPAEVLGCLSERQWLQARAILRRLLLKPSGLEVFEGYLMKRKIHDSTCTECVDPHTGGIKNTDCSNCHGTGIVEGYWQAAENIVFDMQPKQRHSKRDKSRGTINDRRPVMAKAIGLPMMHARDVWIDKCSDKRYVVHNVEHLSELNGVPIVAQVEMRLAQFTDPVYGIPLEGT